MNLISIRSYIFNIDVNILKFNFFYFPEFLKKNKYTV